MGPSAIKLWSFPSHGVASQVGVLRMKYDITYLPDGAASDPCGAHARAVQATRGTLLPSVPPPQVDWRGG
jgi:hypothetical protein